MMTAAPLSTAIDALARLTPDEIRQRLSELTAEEKALRTLLRATVARDRAAPKKMEAVQR